MSIFYQKKISGEQIILPEEESRHCSQVLRHQPGDTITVFDGLGNKYHARLTAVSKKKCEAQVESIEIAEKRPYHFHLAIAPTKNLDRMEWLVEKLCELGADQITLLETAHSERRKVRVDRLEKKAISAMKQSGNPFLPSISELTKFSEFLIREFNGIKAIAHVHPEHKYLGQVIGPNDSLTILIGPEGDFSSEEVKAAEKAGFRPVSLGYNTLRTETAGLKACCLFSLINNL